MTIKSEEGRTQGHEEEGTSLHLQVPVLHSLSLWSPSPETGGPKPASLSLWWAQGCRRPLVYRHHASMVRSGSSLLVCVLVLLLVSLLASPLPPKGQLTMVQSTGTEAVGAMLVLQQSYCITHHSISRKSGSATSSPRLHSGGSGVASH